MCTRQAFTLTYHSSSKKEPFKLKYDNDMGGGDPIRTWFLRYICSIGDMILKTKHAMVETNK